MQFGCWPQAQAAEALGVGDGWCPAHLPTAAKADGRRFLPMHSIFIHMREDLCPTALCKLEKHNLLIPLSSLVSLLWKIRLLCCCWAQSVLQEEMQSDCTCRTDYVAGELYSKKWIVRPGTADFGARRGLPSAKWSDPPSYVWALITIWTPRALWCPRLRVLKVGANKEGGSVPQPFRAPFWVLLGSVQ